MSLHQAGQDVFWHWITERHRIYERRAAGQPKPWTDDPILRDYKFTNVFRELDRGTVWLREHFIEPHWDADPALLAFNLGWYRLFNWTGTGERLGWQTEWRKRGAAAKLKRAQARGEQVFTGAHIVWGEFGMPKIDGVLLSCDELWKQRAFVAKMARFTRSLEGTFEALTQLRGIGGFIAYEIVSDYRHTPLLSDARDINTWANVGPGAMRGLKRLYPGIKPSEALQAMRELLARSAAQLPDDFPTLELRDVEHSLCEFSKYCKIKFGDGRMRSKYPGAA